MFRPGYGPGGRASKKCVPRQSLGTRRTLESTEPLVPPRAVCDKVKVNPDGVK
jgi:hypothetical protein